LRSAVGVEESAHFFFGFFLGLAIAFLDQSGQLFRVAFGAGQFVIGQVAPRRLRLASQLLPFACNDLVVHGADSLVVERVSTLRARTTSVKHRCRQMYTPPASVPRGRACTV